MSAPARIVVTPPGVPVTPWRDALSQLPATRADSALGLPTAARVLVLAAHPDDETLGFGAAAAELAAGGHEVLAACLTDGAAAFTAVGVDVPDLAATRSRELDAALAVVGARRCPVAVLPDGGLATHTDELTASLTRLVEAVRPEVVVAPWSGDPHPDHAALGEATGAVCAAAGVRAWGYPVWLTHVHHPFPAPLDWGRVTRLESAPPWLAAKVRAIAAYRSQTQPVRADLEAVLPVEVVERLTTLPELIVG